MHTSKLDISFIFFYISPMCIIFGCKYCLFTSLNIGATIFKNITFINFVSVKQKKMYVHCYIPYQLVLVRCYSDENGFWKHECSELFCFQVCDTWWSARVVLTLHNVNSRLVLVHGVQDDLLKNKTGTI